jgi:aryl-alcohol dehydrogenase-like predicted oxidoreductase
VQVNFNLVDQRAAENGLFDLCRQGNVGVIVRTPLCFGFLTGKVDAESGFDSSDHRLRWSVEQRRRWADSVRAFVSALGQRRSQTPAQIALRFCLSFGAVSSVIPGMLTVGEVEENTYTSVLGELDERDRSALSGAYRSGDFFVGR